MSGHKYGLVSPGVGWAVWRSKDFLPEELVFHVAYLGADQASFTLNFSKSAQQVIAQYAVLIRYGKAGFRSIMSNVTNTADYVAEELTKTGRFTIISQGGGKGLPLIAFKMKDKKHYDVFAIASQLRQRNWVSLTRTGHWSHPCHLLTILPSSLADSPRLLACTQGRGGQDRSSLPLLPFLPPLPLPLAHHLPSFFLTAPNRLPIRLLPLARRAPPPRPRGRLQDARQHVQGDDRADRSPRSRRTKEEARRPRWRATPRQGGKEGGGQGWSAGRAGDAGERWDEGGDEGEDARCLLDVVGTGDGLERAETTHDLQCFLDFDSDARRGLAQRLRWGNSRPSAEPLIIYHRISLSVI